MTLELFILLAALVCALLAALRVTTSRVDFGWAAVALVIFTLVLPSLHP